jgi:2-C-methyl-D-erythritol 2,4-cyclodiphosphate synthase
MRVGFGFDAHRFTTGRSLFLGGIQIPYKYGLEGYSDADVVLHALIDSLLGAACLGDIGQHFPPGDSRFKDISSVILLEEVVKIISDAGYEVVNVDVVALLEEPRLSPYLDTMRERIADVLGVDVERVSIKATTTEGMGFTGRGEGIAAQAVALLKSEGE